MANIKQEFKYNCDNDCIREGCPSHKATLEFHSASNTYTFDDGQGGKMCIGNNLMEVFVKGLKHLSDTRADTVKV